MLVDVVVLVGGRQDLRLVDVVDAERLEHLRLDEMADPRLGHDRDADRIHDPDDHRWVGHAGDAAGLADVSGHALERHHGDGAGILGDLGLVGRDDVHDDAALEHLGEALLGGPGGRFDGHGSCGSSIDGRGAGPRRGDLARGADYRTRSPFAKRSGPFGPPCERWTRMDRSTYSGSNVYRVMSLGNVVQANALTGCSSHNPPWTQCSSLAS